VTVPLEGFALIVHHNPNNIAQRVTRIRLWDSEGTLTADTGPISVAIPANGAEIILAFDEATGFVGDMFQALVNWTQGQDKAAPLPRVDMFPDGTLTSAVRTPCP
jgi:hypothetical protein